MLHIGIPRSLIPPSEFLPEYDGFHYEPYPNDSGGAIMILAYGKFFLRAIHFNGNMNGNPLGGANKDGLIACIAKADEDAMAAGLIDAPTGLLPTFVDIDELESFPMPVPPVL
jgi:hypothetical protein